MLRGTRILALQWLLLVTLGLVALYMSWGGLKVNRILVLSDGVSTCFNRLHQSYTAKLAQGGEKYLTKSFLRDTESCFSQAVSYMEGNFDIARLNSLSGLNTLGTDVRWFNQMLNRAEEVSPRLGPMFSKLEEQKDELLAKIEGYRQDKIKDTKQVRGFFFLILAAIPLIFLLNLILTRRRRKRSVAVTTAPVPIPPPTSPKPSPEKAPLSDILGNVFEALSGKIFTLGIKLKFNLDDNIRIAGKEEVIEQAFYHLLSYLLKSAEGSKRLISVSGHQNGEMVLVEIFCYHRVFDRELLAGVKSNAQLQITSTLIEEFGGKMTLSNIVNDEQKTIGSKVQLNLGRELKKAKARRGRLRHLRKGKKRELLRQMSSQ